MHGSMSLPRTKCADSIPGGRGSGGQLPAAEGERWHHARLAPAALTQESPEGTRRARLQRECCGSVPAPHPAPPSSRANASLPTMSTHEANCFNSTRIQKLFCSAETRGEGKKKQRTMTLSFNQERLPGSTKCFQALSKSHWNQQRPSPFLSVDTGRG